MQNYQNRSYTVQAKEMTRLEYNQYRGWQIPENENPEDKGYMVINPNISERNVAGVDGYVSWLPEKAFAEVYEAEPQTWQGLLLEYRQLQERTEKLYQFLSANPEHEAAEILSGQYHLMRQYLDVLKYRVGDMGETTHALPPALEPFDKDVIFLKINNNTIYALETSYIKTLLSWHEDTAQITRLFADEEFPTGTNGERKELAEILLIKKDKWKQHRHQCWDGRPMRICCIDEDE